MALIVSTTERKGDLNVSRDFARWMEDNLPRCDSVQLYIEEDELKEQLSTLSIKEKREFAKDIIELLASVRRSGGELDATISR